MNKAQAVKSKRNGCRCEWTGASGGARECGSGSKGSRGHFPIIRRCVAAVLLTGSASHQAGAQSLSFLGEQEAPVASYTFGTSYDYISQTFYTAMLDTATDSIDAASKLNQEYLNQPGIFVGVELQPFRDQRLTVQGYAEQSRDYLRGRLSSQLALRGAVDRLSGDIWLETRQRNRGAREVGDEFILGRGRLKWSRNVSPGVRPFVALQGEFNDLSEDDTISSVFSSGYQKASGQAGVEFEIGRFDRLMVGGTVETRNVPDDRALEYDLLRLEVEYTGFSGGSFYSLEASIDRRDYNPLGNANDQSWGRLGATGQFDLGKELTLDPRFSLEVIDYTTDTSFFNLDQTLATVELRLLRRWGMTTVGLGPRFQRQGQSDPLQVQTLNAITAVTAVTQSEDLSESYSEFGAVATLEYFKIGTIMLTLENQLGSRTVDAANAFQSDYWFDRVSLFSSLDIAAGLKLDLIGSIEWESHDQPSDDNAFYLLNSSLTYGF
ncbi:MAG: hypothetical protein ACE5GA_00920 [Candidatus Zixiibacteriota bacterium]